MEYNTQRKKMIIPEYGRHIQKMVDYCLTIENREERNEYAQTIVVAMGQVNPVGKDAPHYKQKLWDHLYIISDYKLDVDFPFPKPVREEKDEKPTPLKYSQNNISFRTYGTFLEALVKKVATMDDGEEKQNLIHELAQHMKKLYLQYNINTCDEAILRNHINILSEGKITLGEDFQFKSNKELLGIKKKNPNNKNNKKK